MGSDEIRQQQGCWGGATPVVAAVSERGSFAEHRCIIWRCWRRTGVSVCMGGCRSSTARAGGRRWHRGYLRPESLQDLDPGENIPQER